MKKLLLSLSLTFGLTQAFACADSGGEDYYYYNLFSQTLSEAPQYQSFLMTMDNPYYDMVQIRKMTILWLGKKP